MGQSGQAHLSDFPVKLSEGLIEAHPARQEMARRWCLSWVLEGVVGRSEQRVALGGIADFNEGCLVSTAQLQQTTATQPWESTSQLKKVQGSPQGSCKITSSS